MKIKIISKLRKNKLLIIILIFILFLIYEIVNVYNNRIDEISRCENLPSKAPSVEGQFWYPKALCFTDLALKENNVTLCNKIDEETYTLKQACYDEFYRNSIKTLKNSSACEGISFNFSHKGSYVDCYYILALETKESIYCDESTDPNSCYFDVALEAEDPSACDKINSTYEIEFRVYPFSIIRWKDYCYIKINACERIENITLREYCLKR